jgi:hypothetical protein
MPSTSATLRRDAMDEGGILQTLASAGGFSRKESASGTSLDKPRTLSDVLRIICPYLARASDGRA